MQELQKITPEFIWSISYTDFVGLVNQWNVPPGAYDTLSKWRVFSDLTQRSRLLEIACTTGFSSRELALLSGCVGEGFDISERSVAMAEYNRQTYASQIQVSYVVADGYTYKSAKPFTHIVVGAALGFFPDPVKMLQHCTDLLVDGGYVLASPFYVTQPVPDTLIERAREVFGITPTTVSYKEIMRHYTGLEVLFEVRSELIQETEAELAHYCESTVERACIMLNITDGAVRQAIYDRLYSIKKMSNDLRPYQGYSVLVLRYRTQTYPRRYVELF